MGRLKRYQKKAVLSTSLAVFYAGIGHAQADLPQCVILGNSSPPVSVIEEGQLKGIGLDMLRQLLVNSGYDADRCKIQPTPWTRVYHDIQSKEGHIVVGLARTAMREDLFKWVGPIYQVNMALIAKKKANQAIENLNQLKGRVVGVIRETGPAQILEASHDFTGHLEYAATPRANLRKLAAGRIDYFAHAYPMVLQSMNSLGMDPHDYEPAYSLGQVDLYFALSPKTSDTDIAHLQKVWKSLSDTMAKATQ